MILIEKKEEKMADQIKKSFNIPVDLNKRWDEMHPSKKDHSVSAAAAMLLWVALDDMPGLREQLRKLGQGPINASTLRKVKDLLIQELSNQRFLEKIAPLSPETQMGILSLLEKEGKLISDGKV